MKQKNQVIEFMHNLNYQSNLLKDKKKEKYQKKQLVLYKNKMNNNNNNNQKKYQKHQNKSYQIKQQ